MAIPKLFKFLFHVCFLCRLSACDPILESLIFAKGRLDRLDSALRTFSTHLSELGRAARDGLEYTNELIEAKTTWLKVYQDFYLNPPQHFSSRLAQWQSELEKIAALLKLLAQQDAVGTHRSVLTLQTLLTGLYEPLLQRGFHERHKVFQSMMGLLKRACELEDPDSVTRLQKELASSWPQHLKEGQTISPQLQQIELENSLRTLQSVCNPETERAALELLRHIQIRAFEDLQ